MKKLKVGMIGGGGAGNFFGMVHRRAIEMDTTREVVAGALRRHPKAAMEAAEAWGIEGFSDYRAMLDAWTSGKLELDYVTIVTPNDAHFGPAMACVKAGLPVMCEKPMTFSVKEARALAAAVRRKKLPFGLAHTYTGHPMMMLAKAFVKRGDIGDIRKIESWYTQGWLAEAIEKSGQQQASWRTDPKRTGISNCGGDIGTHAFVAATWVSGLSVKKVSARLNTFVKGRVLDDDFNVIAEMSNGATAIITATQIAIGHKNDNGFRLFGSKGSLEWHQEAAEHFVLNTGDCDRTYWLNGGSFFPADVASYLRLPGGHNEDFLEALANLHGTLERKIRRRNGEKNIPAPFDHPGVDEGVAGMEFVAAAVASSKRKGAWTPVKGV